MSAKSTRRDATSVGLTVRPPKPIAAAALGYGGITVKPTLVASRRVDFPLKLNALSQWKYRQVAAFLCASECIRQILIGQGIPRERALTIHEGIDLAHVDAAPPVSVRETFWLPTNAPVVGCVGALVEHKGHRYLVHAAADIVRAVPDARIVILGEGDLRDELSRLIHELGLERHVLLPGFRPDVLSLLKAVDVFVMPSITEGLGTSILDAMACRKAVVASAVGGIPEVVEDGRTGLLVPARDASALGTAIVRLLRDPSLAGRLAAAGRARVEQRFTADRMVQDTLDVYRRLRA